MQLFDITEAQHFSAPLTAHLPGTGQSLSAFHRGLPPRTALLQEGTTSFNIHRVSLLNAVERWILFGVADYRRALDMFIPSNAPWAHVTLYYSSFFGANAILGMFGGWLDYERMVEVDQGTPNAQVLRISRRLRSPSGYKGSHKIFWDNFYEGCSSKISPWVPAELQPAITPVNGDRAWLITTRNDVNYDMHGAAVMGAGTIGLLATLALRLRGLEVTTFALARKPNLNAELIEAIGGRYASTGETPIPEGAKKFGPFDLIFEATGFSPVVFDSMRALAKNAVLVLSSVTGGDRRVEVPADKINLEFVLGNKVMVGTVNAAREHFEAGVRDMAQAEAQYPGWLRRLLTHPVKGLENHSALFQTLTTPNGAIKVFCEVAEL